MTGVHHDYSREVLPGVLEIRFSGACGAAPGPDVDALPVLSVVDYQVGGYQPGRILFDFTELAYGPGDFMRFLFGVPGPQDDYLPVTIFTNPDSAPNWKALADACVPGWREGTQVRVEVPHGGAEYLVLASVPDPTRAASAAHWRAAKPLVASAATLKGAIARLCDGCSVEEGVTILDLAQRPAGEILHHVVLRAIRAIGPRRDSAIEEHLFGAFHARASTALEASMQSFRRRPSAWRALGRPSVIEEGRHPHPAVDDPPR